MLSSAQRLLALHSIIFLALITTANAQTETIIYAFNSGSGGLQPSSGLIADSAGNLYGTTLSGGTNDLGTVFELSKNFNGTWSENVLYSFSGGDGNAPNGNLIFDSNGNLYGTTISGGANSFGTVYTLVLSGGAWNERVLYNFAGGADGAFPYAGVVKDSAGNLYGTTTFGGGNANCTQSNPNYDGCGTVFEIDTSSQEHILHSFSWGADGAYPYGGVTLDTTGNLYGTTFGGGTVDGNPDGCDLGQGQEIFIAHDFPAFEYHIGLADYVPACVAGDQEGILFPVFAAIENLHYIPSRTKSFARAGSIRHRGFQFGRWHCSENSTESKNLLPSAP